jgi:general secretion pathway protein E
MAQRLVRVLCSHCKQVTEPDEDAWKALTQPWKTDLPARVYEPVGCLECRETGFQGRQGIYEVMPFTENLHTYAQDKSDLPKLRRQAYKDGMLSLRLSGAMKVAAGVTTIAEVMRVAPEIS